MASVVVEPAGVEDAPGILHLMAVVGAEGQWIANEGPAMTVEQQRRLIQGLNPQDHLLLVARAEGTVVGTLEMVRGPLPKMRHTATVGMALLPDWRGQRLGERLLRAAERWAAQVGVEKISLSVFATNLPAIRLYRRLGYVEEGRRRGQYRIAGALVDELWMAKWSPFD
ncbi:MAG: GNAT family N-acetyltransferase [Firmicutes bacterium]|nr:GNAT family N-acetyltransferase [Alicyclobacillaceae bacterium]MCL6496578.1 GNAT family N-acetyltransferase [Bacillota bacterium]